VDNSLFDLTSIPEVIPDPNPMVNIHGITKGKKCKECSLLFARDYHNRVYYKCTCRGETRGSGTDHRVNWNAL